MSNPALQLAASIASQPIQNGDPAERLASALLEANRDCLAANERYADLYRRFNSLQHENEALREKLGVAARQTRIEPRHAIYCMNPDCSASIIRDELPPDDAVPAWLRGLGWSEDGACPGCKS